jgi:hypothetical protein
MSSILDTRIEHRLNMLRQATMIDAGIFWEKFQPAVRAARPEDYGAKWTEGMYAALHRVQSELGLWCQCRFHRDTNNGRSGERLGIDFMWYPGITPGLDEHESEWIPPLVAIEHENSWSSSSRSVDHWKVSQITAPLRVFIGYTSKARDVETEAKKLQAREPRWHAVDGGQAMIIFGHNRMNHTGFRAWCAPQRADTWIELPRVP